MQWKPVLKYEEFYSVSEKGDIRREKKVNNTYKGKIMSSFIVNKYLNVVLCKYGKMKIFRVHKIVAEAFIGDRPEKFTINHKDGNKLNNHFSNLEYMSFGDNNRHAFLNGLMNNVLGSKNHLSKLKEMDAKNIRNLRKECGISYRKIADMFNITIPNVHSIVKNKTWKHI